MTNKAERKKATRIASESDQVLDFQKRLQKKLMKKKKNQVGILELKSIITEIKKITKALDMNWQKKIISEFEDRAKQVMQVKEQWGKKNEENEVSFREMKDTIKYTNIHTTGVPGVEGDEEGREEEWKKIFKEII